MEFTLPQDNAHAVPGSRLTRVYCAIGDVHGEAERLSRLHEAVFDHWRLLYGGLDLTLVHLGDYVDRGPDSCGVIDRIRAVEREGAETGRFEVVSLAGNHEQMMIAALDGGTSEQEHWIVNGGGATLDSYEAAGRAPIDLSHVAWLKSLPSLHWVRDEGLIFVHAGIHPEDFPNDRPEVHLWTRSRRFFQSEEWANPQLDGQTVVHGHTPTDDHAPDISADARRINIDTGAVYGGRLTAAIFAPGQPVRFLHT